MLSFQFPLALLNPTLYLIDLFFELTDFLVLEFLVFALAVDPVGQFGVLSLLLLNLLLQIFYFVLVDLSSCVCLVLLLEEHNFLLLHVSSDEVVLHLHLMDVLQLPLSMPF